MILKRFKTDNLHYDYSPNIKKDIEPINETNIETTKSDVENMSKLELLSYISKNWNENLSNKYDNVRTLFTESIDNLLNIKSDLEAETITDIKEIVETISIDNLIENNNQKLIDTVAELTMKYGDNDAVETIRIDEGKIIFDLLCDTNIEQSVTTYNGFDLHYNKICSIPTNENMEDKIEIDEISLEQQSIDMNSYFNKLF